MHDLRDAVRSLRSTPVVSMMAILSLALGIGANTAIFSILDSLLIGMATSNVRPTSTPKNCGGVTPMIVNGTCSTVSVRPIASAAPSKRRCQKP